jgi:EAL domain-containing protein (putative c-di-GMP-specific phosphodiesterase class I)/CheY-like chemotaxis protein/GGDEF domain-containing protein
MALSMAESAQDLDRGSSAETRARILCVDDEPNVLDGIARHLRRRYTVGLATSGADGLAYLREHPDTAVIVSDMQMPGMNGAAFLAAARGIVPDARRILLTGYSDPASTIAAINEGQICRFLSKPCEPKTLAEAVESALADYGNEMQNRSEIRRLAVQEVTTRDRGSGLASRESWLETLGETLGEALISPGLEGAAAVYLLCARVVPAYAFDLDSSATDSMIAQIAARLTASQASFHCIARWDTQSFALLERGFGLTPQQLLLRGQDLCDAVTFSTESDGARISVQATVGIVAVTSDMTDCRVVMGHAELAELAARDKGAGRPFLYTSELGESAAHRRTLVRALRDAIAEDQLELNYQPIVDIKTGCLHSVEALARWHHPQHGVIAPGTFIPLAESAGLIVPFGEWALRRACREAGAIFDKGFPHVALNVSVIQLLDPEFLYGLYLALDQAGLEPCILEIEVTESVFAQDMDRLLSILLDVRKLGIRIAIDDFGAGYSSLTYLSRLPVSIIKTDGAFMRDFERGGEAIIAATMGMAEKFGLETIVEGVETAAMLENARRIGASLVQGYYFARPMPLSALDAWVEGFSLARH